jgi:transposase-like protein
MRQTFRWDRPTTIEPSRNDGAIVRPADVRRCRPHREAMRLAFAKLSFSLLQRPITFVMLQSGELMRTKEARTEETERVVWELRCSGWSVPEIARHLGCSHTYALRLWKRKLQQEMEMGTPPPTVKRWSRGTCGLVGSDHREFCRAATGEGTELESSAGW